MAASDHPEGQDDIELDICGGYDDEGMEALLELAGGDRIRVNDTEAALTRTDPVSDSNRAISWARMLTDDDDERYLLAVRLGEGTYIYTETEGKWGQKEEVEALSVVELADVGWCEVCTVYLPTGGNHPADETHHIRASDQDEAKQKLKGRTPPIDYYAAIYTDVGGRSDIINAARETE